MLLVTIVEKYKTFIVYTYLETLTQMTINGGRRKDGLSCGKDLEPFSMFILMDKEVSLIPSSVGRFSSLMALFAA